MYKSKSPESELICEEDKDGERRKGSVIEMAPHLKASQLFRRPGL